jgi:hypothetical protein
MVTEKRGMDEKAMVDNTHRVEMVVKHVKISKCPYSP